SPLRKLLEQVRDASLSPDEAITRLRHLPFEDLGFARIDHHRPLRTGMPEVIYAASKTPEQVAEVFQHMAEHGTNVLATRATAEKFEAVRSGLPEAEVPARPGCHVLRRKWEKRAVR